jgi:hypothetical protein
MSARTPRDPTDDLTAVSWAASGRDAWASRRTASNGADQSVGLVNMRKRITITSTASTIPTVVPRLESAWNSVEAAPAVERRNLVAECRRLDEQPEADRDRVQRERGEQPELGEAQVANPHHQEAGHQ